MAEDAARNVADISKETEFLSVRTVTSPSVAGVQGLTVVSRPYPLLQNLTLTF